MELVSLKALGYNLCHDYSCKGGRVNVNTN